MVGLACLSSLRVLNLSNNELTHHTLIATLVKLTCLYFNGNPVCGIQHYRDTMIAAFPELTFLDDMPVGERDRRLAEAFMRGGSEAEETESAAILQATKGRRSKEFDDYTKFRADTIACAELAEGISDARSTASTSWFSVNQDN